MPQARSIRAVAAYPGSMSTSNSTVAGGSADTVRCRTNPFCNRVASGPCPGAGRNQRRVIHRSGGTTSAMTMAMVPAASRDAFRNPDAPRPPAAHSRYRKSSPQGRPSSSWVRCTTATLMPAMKNGAVQIPSVGDRRTPHCSPDRIGGVGGVTHKAAAPRGPFRISGSPARTIMFDALAMVPPLTPPRIGPTVISISEAGRPCASIAAACRRRTPSSLGTESYPHIETIRTPAFRAAVSYRARMRRTHGTSPVMSATWVPVAMHASINGSPTRSYGPAVVSTTRVQPVIARIDSASPRSATTTSGGATPVAAISSRIFSSRSRDRPAIAQRRSPACSAAATATRRPV